MTDQSMADAGQNSAAPVTDPACQGAATDHASASTDQVRQLFDAKAANWAAKYAPGGRLAGRVRLFTSALTPNVPPGGQVLDLGCGTGELARVLASAGWPVTACDISEQMLGRAIVRDEAGTVEWVLLDPAWRVLPFERASFDAITASSLLEYIDDPGAVLRECARLLRPGGVVLCTVPDMTHPVRWLEWLVGWVSRFPRLGGTGRSWAIIGGYLTYLQISRHRHSAGWWSAAAMRAGLLAVPSPQSATPRAPLRLFTFKQSDK